MALAYLLCPTFQIENTAGKPAGGGWLEVYIAGSRERYYCASDFNGTLHPFRIELDSLGSNIVLANDTQAYDVYVYNRYGGLMMSRYGVKPGAGGGISAGSITSTDGSIIVTPTANGVDLRVDSELPTSMRCSAADLQESDTFEFVEEQRNGADASVNNNGQVVVNSGWWHYDVVVRLKWPANPAENITSSISLHAPNGSSSSYFDRSYSHDETLQLSGEYKCTQDGTVFPVSIQGVPSGMTVELVDFGIHSVTGEGGGGGVYNAGNGIVIDEPNRVISVDFDDVQAKLTAGTGITIDENNVISATEAEIYTVEYTSSIVEGTALFDDAYAAYEAGKTLVLNWASADWKGSCIGYYSAYGLMFSVEKVNLSGNDATDGLIQYLWLYKYGTQSRWRSSSLKLLPRSSAADAGKVLMVNPEYPTSHPIWQELPAQQQADWTQSDSTAADYIQHKPDLSVYATQTDLTNGLATKQDTISDLSDIRAGAQAGSTAVQPATLNDYVTNSALATTLADYVTDTELDTILEGYATTTALSTGLAGKQDTIADLSNIRSGAALGATAVQPATLDSYQEKLTAGSNIQISAQNVISAADTTYTAGTALSLTGTEFSVKVDGTTVTVNASGELQAAPAITVDQTYDATSTNPQSGTAVAQAVAGVDTSLFEAVYGQTSLADIQQAIANKRIVYCRVPSGNMARMAFLAFDFGYSVEFQYYRSLSSHSASDMTDEVYVYTVSSTGWTTTTRKTGVKVTAGTHMSQSYSGGTLTLNAAWPTVDQTYDASSTNAQSGVAVAGALATKQDTLTAGTNITISAQNEISAVDTTYTAGSGLDLTGTEFSVDTNTVALKSDLPIQQQLVPGYSLPADEGKVLTAGSTTYWSSLSDYVTDTELSTILQGYQEALTAGSNIQISNGTISATDTTYSAGNGLSLSGTEFSVDTNVVATQADLADYTPTASLGAVALSNDYDDLDNKPTIPVLPATKDLVAGNNITITEGQDTVTIAATAASYSAGSGLNLTGSTFSVDTATIQEKLTAGSNITISGNTISSTAAPQLQANWAEGNTQSVQYIMNKPTIPVLPSTKDLVAGDNITLTEGNDDITVACSITIGTVTV